ncbi:MAG TPA: Flp pilus assembly protein CpaB [Acidimicrobiales bacterium]
MTKRPNILVGLGIALFLVGGAIVFFVLQGGHHSSHDSNRKVPVLVARADVATGATGDDLVSGDKVAVEQVEESERAPDALSSTSSLAGQIVSSQIGKGGQVRSANLRPQTLRSASVRIPKGHQAVAVSVDYTAGVAGYAGPGDHVNLYASVSGEKAGAPASLTGLLLSDITVLDVSKEVAPLRAGPATSDSTTTGTARRGDDSDITLLLSVTSQEANQIVFANQFNSLYFTVLPDHDGHNHDQADPVTYAHGFLGIGK